MEWQVFGVIAALAAFVTAIVAPIIKLNASITKLTVTVERLVKDMDAQSRRSHDAHERLWEHQDAQDKTLTNHEIRITKLENGKETTT